MTIVNRPYAEFRAQLSERLNQTRVPFGGSFELTPRCNFTCPHCYLQEHKGDGGAISTAQVLAILPQLSDAGCLTLAFTGGEPLLRSDYFDIHEAAHRMGFWISLLTNGSLIDEQLADRLATLPPRVVEISLYGADGDTYKKITGRKDHFEKVATGIDLLLERNIRVVVKTVLLTQLAPHIDDMKQFAADRGLELVTDPNVTATLERDATPIGFRDDPANTVAIEFANSARAAKMVTYHAGVKENGPSIGAPMCSAGYTGFHIDYRGHLMRCIMLREPSFDLTRTSLDDAWDKLGELPRPVLPANSACYDCDVQHLCGFCPGALYCGEDAPENKDSFYCRVADQRLAKIESSEAD